MQNLVEKMQKDVLYLCPEYLIAAIMGYEQPVVTCDAFRDLLPFVQFKKREKHPWRSVTFSKFAGFSLLLY